MNDTLHLWADGQPYTLIVFGPYPGDEWDVEVHLDHVTDNSHDWSYLGTHTIYRDSHIVEDMIPYARRCLESVTAI